MGQCGVVRKSTDLALNVAGLSRVSLKPPLASTCFWSISDGHPCPLSGSQVAAVVVVSPDACP